MYCTLCIIHLIMDSQDWFFIFDLNLDKYYTFIFHNF